MSGDQTRIALLEHRLDAAEEQTNRLISHFGSESRARDHLKDRAALIEKTLARIEDRLDRDRIDKERERDDKRWDFKSILLVLTTIASLVSTLIMAIKS